MIVTGCQQANHDETCKVPPNIVHFLSATLIKNWYEPSRTGEKNGIQHIDFHLFAHQNGGMQKHMLPHPPLQESQNDLLRVAGHIRGSDYLCGL